MTTQPYGSRRYHLMTYTAYSHSAQMVSAVITLSEISQRILFIVYLYSNRVLPTGRTEQRRDSRALLDRKTTFQDKRNTMRASNLLRTPKTMIFCVVCAISCGEDDSIPGEEDIPVSDMGSLDMGMSDTGTPDAGSPDMGNQEPCAPLGTLLPTEQAPPARDDMAFAFDNNCERVFVFFGDTSTPQACNFPAASFVNQAFVFDTRREQWSQLDIPVGPLPADRAGAIWDELGQRVIVFGGRWRAGTSGPYDYPTEVWAYSVATNTWEQLDDGSNGPSGRMDFVMLKPTGQSRFIISHGGQLTPDFTGFDVFSDTWSFDLATQTWTEIATSGPQPEATLYPAFAYDSSRGHLWVYSGSGTDAFSAGAREEMWQLDLASELWTDVGYPVDAPIARFNSAMIYDEDRDRLVLFGGHDNSNVGNNNDLWAFDLSQQQWASLKEGDTFNAPSIDFCTFPGNFTNPDLTSPERRAAHLFLQISPSQAMLYGGNTDCGITNDTWFLNLGTDEWTQVSTSSVGMTCSRNGTADCTDPEARMCLE